MSEKVTISQALQLAQAHLRRGDVATARTLCAQVLKAAPNLAGALHLMGVIASEAGDPGNQVIPWFERAVAQVPDDSTVLAGLAGACVRARRGEQALRAATRASELEADKARNWELRGEAELLIGDFDAAGDSLARARSLGGESDELHAAEGILMNSIGDFAAAEAAFARFEFPQRSTWELRHHVIARHYDDALRNRRSRRERILILRHPVQSPGFYETLFRWIRKNAPEYWDLFELRQLPCRIDPRDGYIGLHCWLQDPVQMWSPRAYEQALAISRDFESAGIPVLNSVDRYLHAGKLEGSRRMRAAGLPVPECTSIDDPDAFRARAEELTYPLILREDWGHGAEFIRVDDAEALRAARIEKFSRPLAQPLVDAVADDGNFRKFRFIAMGKRGLSHHMMVTPHWITRGGDRYKKGWSRKEELAYTNNLDPNAELFQAGRRALELELVAFDYGYDREGGLVVWEANPYPLLRFPRDAGHSRYRVPANHRTQALLLAGYLDHFGLPVPEWLDVLIDPTAEGSDEVVARLEHPGRH